MFAVIYIPDFYLQAALRGEPERHVQPVALMDEAASSAILQLTAAAREMGVCEGMTSTQALARCRNILIKNRCLAQENAATEALLSCAFSVSPRIEATDDGICTIDLKGLIESNYASLAQRVITQLVQLHLFAQAGVAANPSLALHAARCARPFLFVEHSKEFLTKLPIASIGPTEQTLAVLRKWGIQTVGAFLALGKEHLAERLGVEALELYDRASAHSERPLRLSVPRVVFEEAIDFENEIETLEPLLFILRRFLEQITLRLELAGFVAETLNLRLIFSNRSHYECRFNLPAPTRKVETLFRVLHTHLENLRTEFPITGLRLTAKHCQPASQQFGLFETALRDPNQFAETLARLSALVGADRVGTPRVEPSHRPDAFRMEPVKFIETTSGRKGGHVGQTIQHPSQPGLSLRRFRPPFRVEVVLRENRPASFRNGDGNRIIQQAEGPWRSSGDWWEKEAWARDEWDVQTSTGTLYRLHREQDDWFLDGVFD